MDLCNKHVPQGGTAQQMHRESKVSLTRISMFSQRRSGDQHHALALQGRIDISVKLQVTGCVCIFTRCTGHIVKGAIVDNLHDVGGD